MVDENQVQQYIKAIKIDALSIERTEEELLKQTAVEGSEAYHTQALQLAFNRFCSRKAATDRSSGSIGDKAKLYDTLAEVARRLPNVVMPV